MEGEYDAYNISATELMKDQNANLAINRVKHSYHDKVRKVRGFPVIFNPSSAFLSSNLQLLPNVDLTLTFERAAAALSFLKVSKDKDPDISKTVLEIKNPIATTTYISSPYLRNFFSTIEDKPIDYVCQEIDVSFKMLPQNETSIIIDNARGGNYPSYIFFAIAPASALTGSILESSTGFYLQNVKKVDISCNGTSVSGYPIEIDYNVPVQCYKNYMEVLDRYMNNSCGAQLSLSEYGNNLIHAYKFSGDETASGWISFKLELKKAFSTPHNLVIWYVFDTKISIDRYHRVEKEML